MIRVLYNWTINLAVTPYALWALADDLRHRKEQGEFLTYEEAYIYGSEHYTHNGAEIKPLSLKPKGIPKFFISLRFKS